MSLQITLCEKLALQILHLKASFLHKMKIYVTSNELFEKSNTTNVTIKCFFPSSTGTGDFTVAFIGSGDGYLKKVVIESDSTGVLYADIPMRPGHSVRPDIVFDLKREHVYVMTDKKVSKVCLL